MDFLMHRTVCFHVVSQLPFICGVHGGSGPAENRGRPNVLFIAGDDMNDRVGSHGTTPRAITPNIDRFATQGVEFLDAHTAGVFCALSRTAIFTG